MSVMRTTNKIVQIKYYRRTILYVFSSYWINVMDQKSILNFKTINC